jgi:hypothetical protein
MRVAQRLWTERGGWGAPTGAPLNGDSSLIFYFGAPQAIADGRSIRELSKLYPSAKLIGCSTGGGIRRTCSTAACRSRRRLRSHPRRHGQVSFNEWANAYDAGRALARKLIAPGCARCSCCRTLHVNGSELVRSMSSALDGRVLITGGLAGDGSRFNTTRVGTGETARPAPLPPGVPAIDSMSITARQAGWDAFGPRREITRAKGQRVVQLDGEPALDLYKRYLGEGANNLPGSALLFRYASYPPGQERRAGARSVGGREAAR